MDLSPDQAISTAKKIFRNECGGSLDKLTHWNQGEEFASLGIGHFIWYPAEQQQKFDQMFPKLLAFMKERGATLPSQLEGLEFCPWNNREAFYADFGSSRMKELRQWLTDTFDWQARFLVLRLTERLPVIVASIPLDQRGEAEKNIERILSEPNGYYALIDYLNFKGDGLSELERYQGEGWGLKQVLLQMRSMYPHSAIEEFVMVAKALLTKRVDHSPPERNEIRWLPGWRNRLNTYQE